MYRFENWERETDNFRRISTESCSLNGLMGIARATNASARVHRIFTEEPSVRFHSLWYVYDAPQHTNGYLYIVRLFVYSIIFTDFKMNDFLCRRTNFYVILTLTLTLFSYCLSSINLYKIGDQTRYIDSVRLNMKRKKQHLFDCFHDQSLIMRGLFH